MIKDKILRFILYARKHPKKKLHLQFTAYKALNSNADFDWYLEEQKAHLVWMLCEKPATKKEIIKSWKCYKKQFTYYNEFYCLAKELLKKGKSKNYETSIFDLLN